MPTLLLDIDGTLMNCRGAGRDAMHAAARQLWGIDNLPEIPLHGRTDMAIFRDLIEAVGNPFGDSYSTFRKFYHWHLESVLAPGRTRAELLPGARLLVDSVAADPNWQAGLLTGNSRTAAGFKIAAAGLAPWLLQGGFGDWHECRNAVARDAVEAFAGSSIGSSSNVTIVIGDTVHDIRCAHSVGALAIGVLTGGGERSELSDNGAALVVDSLAELNLEQLQSLLHQRTGCWAG